MDGQGKLEMNIIGEGGGKNLQFSDRQSANVQERRLCVLKCHFRPQIAQKGKNGEFRAPDFVFLKEHFSTA